MRVLVKFPYCEEKFYFFKHCIDEGTIFPADEFESLPGPTRSCMILSGVYKLPKGTKVPNQGYSENIDTYFIPNTVFNICIIITT